MNHVFIMDDVMDDFPRWTCYGTWIFIDESWMEDVMDNFPWTET